MHILKPYLPISSSLCGTLSLAMLFLVVLPEICLNILISRSLFCFFISVILLTLGELTTSGAREGVCGCGCWSLLPRVEREPLWEASIMVNGKVLSSFLGCSVKIKALFIFLVLRQANLEMKRFCPNHNSEGTENKIMSRQDNWTEYLLREKDKISNYYCLM